MQGIHRLDQGHIGQHQFEFVGLQMADKMPLHVGGHLRNLGGQLLRTALRKDALTGIVRLPKSFYRMEFGNSHQRNFCGKLLPDLLQILLYHKKRCPDKAGHDV